MGKIGIMGGTFDPVHNGHLLLGKQAYEEFRLDEIWYMPSGHPPHKKDHKITTASDRLAMIKLAVAEYPFFVYSDFEINRSGNTYTAHTLELLKRRYPEHTFYFIIGADSLYEIESWHDPQKVMSSTTLLVAERTYEEAQIPLDKQISYLMQKYRADIRRLHCSVIDISSEKIREMILHGESLAAYVPESVAQYICAHQLYQRTV